MPSVLFICSANRFRSPLAAGIFQKALAEEERQRVSTWSIGRAGDWEVTSAGLQAAPGLPVLPDVLDAAAQLGIDLAGHWSQRGGNRSIAGPGANGSAANIRWKRGADQRKAARRQQCSPEPFDGHRGLCLSHSSVSLARSRGARIIGWNEVADNDQVTGDVVLIMR